MKHALILVIVLAACGQTDGYPELLPTELALADPVIPTHASAGAAGPAPAEAAAVSRADALRARADALRGPVVDPALLDRSSRQATGR